MHLDWVDENKGRSHEKRDTETQKLIRRRATHAAAVSRKRRKEQIVQPTYQIEELQPWVVHNSLRGPACSKGTNQGNIDKPSAALQQKTLSTSSVMNLLPRAPHSLQSVFLVPQRLIAFLQGQDFSHNVFQRLMSRDSVPDEQVRHFIVLALADAEYVQAISSCYGRSASLDAAISCLAARVQDFLAGTVENASTFRLYTWALHNLQKSIATAAFSERFEIYYTIPLLVLFELLGPSDQVSYLTHGRGAVHLLHFIGPDGMKTELNKTLLAMQSDIMVLENLRDGQTHCCAALEWQTALRWTIRDDLPPGMTRSEANITLNIIATALPGLFNHVESAVQNTSAPADKKLPIELKRIAAEFLNWQQHWEPVLRAQPCAYQDAPTQMILLAVCWLYTAILNRLIAAAVPAPLEQRLSSEHKALEAANNALEIAAKAESYNIVGQTKLAVVAKLVCSVTVTSYEWQQAIKCTSADQPISRHLFTAWCDRIDRNTFSM